MTLARGEGGRDHSDGERSSHSALILQVRPLRCPIGSEPRKRGVKIELIFYLGQLRDQAAVIQIANA